MKAREITHCIHDMVAVGTACVLKSQCLGWRGKTVMALHKMRDNPLQFRVWEAYAEGRD